jgi:hypothetical protein
MSIGFQRTTRRYIPEDIALHNHGYDNLKSYKGADVFIISNEIISIIVKNKILSDKRNKESIVAECHTGPFKQGQNNSASKSS